MQLNIDAWFYLLLWKRLVPALCWSMFLEDWCLEALAMQFPSGLPSPPDHRSVIPSSQLCLHTTSGRSSSWHHLGAIGSAVTELRTSHNLVPLTVQRLQPAITWIILLIICFAIPMLTIIWVTVTLLMISGFNLNISLFLIVIQDSFIFLNYNWFIKCLCLLFNSPKISYKVVLYVPKTNGTDYV